tara:strand:- start:6086 stop:7588 length:1503 start_codon:yes stop_codon:yes gene_type:complete
MTIIKRFFAKLFAFLVVKKIEGSYSNSVNIQLKILNELIKKASKTKFGLDHNFDSIKSVQHYRQLVPIRDYEGIKKYIEEIKLGQKDVLWPGRPKYLAKTSGTTSGTKFIPITKESMPNHIISSRNALLFYINKTGNTSFLNGKTIFLQGSPELEKINGIFIGRLSGIVAHHIPGYLRKNNLPSLKTNSIDNWKKKVEAVCEETINENMTVIGGIPSWVQMYFEKIIKNSNKKNISEIFKNFELYIYGGVNFSPYKRIFRKLIGKKIDSIEYYPASEGFFAYQNIQSDKSLLLQFNSGIFYEFIKVDEFQSSNYERYTLGNVDLDVNYILVISSNAGLWAYNTGDTIRFTSLMPPKIIVTGRYKHFISAFGEHVISEEVEQSIAQVCKKHKINILEFTVAPMINPKQGLPYHEWWIEFEERNMEINIFSEELDKKIQEKNIYYKDLIKGKVLKRLEIREVKRGGFNEHMSYVGKLGGQNKIPKLSNNRVFVKGLEKFIIH